MLTQRSHEQKKIQVNVKFSGNRVKWSTQAERGTHQSPLQHHNAYDSNCELHDTSSSSSGDMNFATRVIIGSSKPTHTE